MSRGLGKMQRALLSAVQTAPDGWLNLRLDFLRGRFTRAEYNAAHRAAQSLEQTGLVAAHWYGGGHGRLISLPGVDPRMTPSWEPRNWHEQYRPKCWQCSSLGNHQHLTEQVQP